MSARGSNWPRAILFDLDGTLIDSAGDLHASVNILLAREGLGPLTLDAVIAMIGRGMRVLTKRAFAAAGRPVTPAEIDRLYHALVEIYAANLTVHTVLLPGAKECLAHWRAAGVPLAVVTNKPEAATSAILNHFELAEFFKLIVGGDSGFATKPAPDMLVGAAKRLGFDVADCLMVGDSAADIESARAAGVASIAVAGGYTPTAIADLGADATVASLADLPEAIASLRTA